MSLLVGCCEQRGLECHLVSGIDHAVLNRHRRRLDTSREKCRCLPGSVTSMTTRISPVGYGRSCRMATTRDETGLYSLVVVGSSAGGIEALSTLVATLPADFPAPLVLAQHLDPTRPSHLGEILARHAPLPVVTVADHAPLRPGTVYVVPANRHVAITAHDMTVLPDGPGRPKPSIDLLLTSAAAVYGPQLIAVILTGTGSDGTAGADAVHAAGGTVMIQNPQTAAFASMPASVAPA